MQSGTRPADFAGVRATNLSVVLRHVRANTPCSRADVAAATGLTRATVSSLVTDLIDRRLLRETGLTGNRIGRPATMLAVDGAAYAAVGMRVSADELHVVAIDLAGETVLSWRRSFAGTASAPDRAVAAIAALAERALKRVTDQGRQVMGLTVGVPGLVAESGVVTRAAGLGWREVDLRGALARSLRHPDHEITVDNDANLAALAEQRHGEHAGTRDLIVLHGQLGIGAGIVADGRLLRGSRGFSGEIGHLPLDPVGPVCPCGQRGCLDTLAGAPALIRRAIPDLDDDDPTADLALDLARVATLAGQDDPTALAALDEVGTHLGQALSLLVNLLNPEVAVLSGYFVPLAPWLMPAVVAQVAARSVAPESGGCRVTSSTLRNDTVALGGATRALDAVDAGRLPRPLEAARR